MRDGVMIQAGVMPLSTRERVLKAAVELLGAEGVRALSHARVDERAGLPPGSTLDWFGTRRALLGGVSGWIAERERADLEPSALPLISGVEEMIKVLCFVVELQSGLFATRTRARYALLLELAHEPELAEPLARRRDEFERWVQRISITVGIADPVAAARVLMALKEGLLLHRLTIDPRFAVRPVIERAVRGLAAA